MTFYLVSGIWYILSGIWYPLPGIWYILLFILYLFLFIFLFFIYFMSLSGERTLTFVLLWSIFMSVIVSFGRPLARCVCSIFPLRMESNANGDTDFFLVVAGVLQRDTSAPYLFSIYLDYVLETSIDLIKENVFTLKKKARSRRFPTKSTQTMQITWRFLQIHLPKTNSCYITWNRQQEALTSTWMQFSQKVPIQFSISLPFSSI